MENDLSLLGICIPTFNRSNILDEALTDLIPKISSFNFNVIISDNASVDDTEKIVKKHKMSYSKIIYCRQEITCGGDRHFEKVLKIGTVYSKYLWLLGDSYRLIESEINNIIAILQKDKYHAIIVNSFDRITQIESKEYDSGAELLKEIGGHMTLMSSFIFNKDLVVNVNFKRYYDSYFIHTGIVYEYMNQFNASIFWYKANCVFTTSISKIKTSWIPVSFEVFAKHWMAFVLSLPLEIPLKFKLYCIKEHNRQTKLFTARYLISLRTNEWFSFKTYMEYKKYIPYVTDTSRILIILISIFPVKILKLGRLLKRRIIGQS